MSFARDGSARRLAVALALGAGLVVGAATDVSAAARVAVSVSPEVAALPGFGSALAPLAWIERVSDPASAALRAEAGSEGLVVRGEDGVPVAPAVPAAAPDAGERIAAQLVGVAHRRAIASLTNPASRLAVSFTLERADGGPDDGPLRRVESGTELRWEARNDSREPLFVLVFAVSPDRGVTLVYPFRGRPRPLAPGHSVDQKGVVDVPEGARTTRDRLQLVATTRFVDPARFLDPAELAGALADLEAGDWTSAHHEISVRREVVEIVEAPPEPIVAPRAEAEASGESDAEARPGPSTAGVLRRPPRVVRFGVHYASPTELGAVEERLKRIRTLCGRGGRACRVRRLFDGADVFELERHGRRLGEGASQTVASAWDQAYEIRRGLEAARVEPFLELEVPFAAGSDGAPAAALDDHWHLDRVRAREAWAALRRAGHARGREAEGVRVGLVDTGWRPHPEITDGAGAATPVRASAGFDFVDDDAAALDPLTTPAPPGLRAHGTGSASLLASPAGCQLAGQAGCAQGLGRGADVAPLRAHRSPAHHDAERLARVLDAAATGALPAPVDVVAIAMAGPPSWALWRAAGRAERAGLLLVASAGSAGGGVLWPARFASTVAVAAVGPACRPWAASGRGPAVDVAAPGDAVWRATVGEDGKDLDAPGSSTGFAASLAAGGAALWLARWQGDARLAALRERGAVTAAFRAALARTSRKPSAAGCAATTRGAELGPGILDAAGLVARPPEAGARPEAPIGLRDLPLFRSLYAPHAGERAKADYARLFGRAPEDVEAVAYLEGEVLHHYAMAREVGAAIDAAVRAAPGAGDWAAARRALQHRGLSHELRDALRAADAERSGPD